MASETKKKFFKEVRPILSLDHHEARRRVLNLYKAWFRQIPFMGFHFSVKYYDVEFSETRCKQKLREEFTKHPQINDIRIIDMLVIKGQMALNEVAEKWISRRGVAQYFNKPSDPTRDCFLAKFLKGND
ncbi:NADH dehydrogenase [ubiquinone] 1 alpha subcomplex subunit 6-like isoform X2 [Dendroctonus ponderosae]|uniref:NADH dehydrogenase [ubiquinone] 1 alpha subcomplex subunit 6 isoform X2 n=1 Tax=Dendroctonus ponderosae TaxID=77166 RepID=UPI0020357731|nr:NADH dehydrogenase [ubiquinone] 1 alpha subcomplex subunit 6 isoform X2 [Dendroctonus ponderosae]XP_048525028.1 NADH dehydrogenase [ubiquinone] 1 alpha subcomplex subunit 6-like isoform X2 [Dendroctonus ponderosae]